MSYKVRDLVQSRKIGAGGARSTNETVRKAVLCVMASYADDDGSNVWVAHDRLAAEAGCSERAARYVLSDFEGEGLIDRVGKRGRAVLWRVNVRAIEMLPPAFDPSSRKGALRHPVPKIPAPGAVEFRHGVPTTLSVEPVKEPKKAMPHGMAAPSDAAALAAPIDFFEADELRDMVAALTEGFDDVLRPGIPLASWAADLHALMIEDGADFEGHIVPGAHAWFVQHRRRAQRDARWEPLNRPLRHPVCRARILAGVQGQFCGDDASGHRGRRKGAGPSRGLKYGRSGAPGFSPMAGKSILTEPDEPERFDYASGDPGAVLWGRLN
jgi:hypothetical protein